MRNENLLQVLRYAEGEETGDEVYYILADLADDIVDAYDRLREHDYNVLLRQITEAATKEKAERLAALFHEFKFRSMRLRREYINLSDKVKKGEI